mmetsp:Transcript_1309/g.1971  ORF Transcript_1309/g.1971 Transcript_1309/m.1971 type:complete len:150 (+) Transcript_1309:154-603(+)
MATRRLLKERASLEKKPISFCSFDLVNEDIYTWRAKLNGPPGPYVNGVFVVEFKFPTQYPFKPPEVRYITKIYHPNVKTDTGEICNDLINGNWGPTLNVKHCIEVLRAMMNNPQSDHPLEPDIATQMREKPKEFEKTAVKYTKEFAMGK